LLTVVTPLTAIPRIWSVFITARLISKGQRTAGAAWTRSESGPGARLAARRYRRQTAAGHMPLAGNRPSVDADCARLMRADAAEEPRQILAMAVPAPLPWRG
jgi:hypothetical protein